MQKILFHKTTPLLYILSITLQKLHKFRRFNPQNIKVFFDTPFFRKHKDILVFFISIGFREYVILISSFSPKTKILPSVA